METIINLMLFVWILIFGFVFVLLLIGDPSSSVLFGIIFITLIAILAYRIDVGENHS